MKGKVMKNLIPILFAFFLISFHSLASGIDDVAKIDICMSEMEQSKICYDINFLKILKKSPPYEYKKISEYTNKILNNSSENCVILEILTDNMISYATLLFMNSEKNMPNIKYDGDRIHIIELNAREFRILKFLVGGIEKFSTLKTVNMYNILNHSSPSPTKYLLLKTNKETISIVGAELLSDEVLYKLKNRDDFGSLYFWNLFISYLKMMNEYGTFKSFGL